MPQCQLLFSAVFGFRNRSKEIFSELDEIKAHDLIIPRSFQNTEEGPEGRPRAPTHGGGAAQGGAPWCVEPPDPLRLRLFAYLSLPDLSLRDGKTTVRETIQSRRHREAKIWRTELSVLARRRDG